MWKQSKAALIDVPNHLWVMASSLQEILPHACIKAGIERDRGCERYNGGGGGEGVGASAPHSEPSEDTEAAQPGKVCLRLIIERLALHDHISVTSRDSPPTYLLRHQDVRGRINQISSLFI